MNNGIKELELFIEAWVDSPKQNKKAFVRLKDYLACKPGVNIDFVPRTGITYSLRAAHVNQKKKPLFAMVDVIEDQLRWLSICFYSGMISDPDEKGVLYQRVYWGMMPYVLTWRSTTKTKSSILKQGLMRPIRA